MSRLTCSQCEGMLLDAADGLLMPEDQTHFDLHVGDCTGCARLFADVRRGSAWMEMLKEAPPVPPAGLVDRVLAKTSGDPVASAAAMAQVTQAASLLGSGQSNVLPFRIPPPRTPFVRIAHAVVQPRFIMTAAMAFFSIALTMNIAGVRLSSMQASDLRPTNLRKSFWVVNGRMVRYYDNLRVVYELESRVREMQRETDGDSGSSRGILSTPQQDEQPSRQAPSGPPRSSAPRLQRELPVSPLQGLSSGSQLQAVNRITPRADAAADVRGKGEQA